ncbi:hypothetical protein [Bdellovibrio sp. HCB-162]|uniref:TraG/VirB4 family ATPase n=1 Tax=Bdellovibrio sp. HCB-162 TaxID=3394234 RepID=UPI0039BCAB7E
MIPELSHVEEYKGYNFWVTADNVVGIGFEISPCDIETEDMESYHHRLSQALRQIDTRILARIRFSGVDCSSKDLDVPRADAFSQLGFTKRKVLLLLDYQSGINILQILKAKFLKMYEHSNEECELLLQTKRMFEQYGFQLRDLSEREVENLFDREYADWVQGPKTIETGISSIGVVRLTKLPFKEFSPFSWIELIGKIPNSFELNISLQRMEPATAQIVLQKRFGEVKNENDPKAKAQSSETEKVIKTNFETGSQVFEIEVLLVIKRKSQDLLVADIERAAASLSLFSTVMVETFGLAPSYCATLPGNSQHVTILEMEAAVAALLPLYVKGEVKQFKGISKRSLTLYREDKSLFHFDIFNPEHSAFNTLIVGTSGKGKSVLTGALTTSLLNDPKVRVIKLDVGGSHSKECELYGGTEYKMTLEKGSGINPFEVMKLQLASDNDKLGIISNLLATLIKEHGELEISKTMRSDVEYSVRAYIEANPQNPCLDDFYASTSNFPRKELLRRWVKGGLYEKAFQQLPGDDREIPKLRYYNFSHVFQASDKEFSQAGVLAVLAQYNIEQLRGDDVRIVLMCDEMPFFINSCFSYFKFSTANERKVGNAVILVAQLSSDFVVNGDTGLIANSPQRFLFSIDDEKEEVFASRFGLRVNDMETMRSLRSVGGAYSEILYQDAVSTRKLKLTITPEEYWRLTTSKTDRDKLQSLMAAVPGLSLKQGIRCLSNL